METQSVRKISWLVIVNLGVGILAFLSGLPALVAIVFLLMRLNIEISSPVGQLFSGYSHWVSEIGSAVPLTGLTLGFVTLILGFIASASIQEKAQRGVAFIGAILGTIGMLGNTVLFIALHAPIA